MGLAQRKRSGTHSSSRIERGLLSRRLPL